MNAIPKNLASVVAGLASVLAVSVDAVATEAAHPDSSASTPPTVAGNAPETDRRTLAGIASIADAFDRNAALYQYLANADRGRIERWLAEIDLLPARPQRDDVARVLYIRFASLDAAGAADYALRMFASPQAVAAVFRAWAHADLDAAVVRAAELPTGPRADAARAILQLDLPVARRTSIAERLGARLADVRISKPAVRTTGEAYGAALARLGAIDDGDSREKEEALLASDWAQADPAGSLTAIVGWDGEASVRDSMLYHVMDEWAKADPRAATDWLLAHDVGESLALVYPAFLALAKVDLAEAESLLATLPAGPARSRGHAGVFDAILERGDLERAVAEFTELDRRSRQMVSGDLGRQLARASPERAFEWLVGLDEEARKGHFPWTLTEIYSQDQSLTKRLIQDVGDHELRIQAARVVADWEMGEPVAGLAWAESLGSDEQVAPVVADMFRAWFERDAQRATAAVMDYPRGAARDLALRTLIGVRLWAFDTVAAERFFDAIDSPEARRSAAEGFYRYYTETDPNERKAAVFRELATEAD